MATTTSSKKDQTFPTWSFDGPCTSMQWNAPAEVQMTVVASPSAEAAQQADVILIGVSASEKAASMSGLAEQLEKSLGGSGLFADLMAENPAFANGAKPGFATAAIRVMAGGKAKRVIFVGLGADPQGVGMPVGGALAAVCQSEPRLGMCSLILPESAATEAILQDLSSMFYQSMYADNRFRSQSKPIAPDLKTVQILCDGTSDALAQQTAVDKGRQLATGIILTKDIVNAPHNVLNSVSLADTARRIASESKDGCMSCEIMGKDECEKRGMGSFLGVARGSETPPQFIHLTYEPPGGASAVKKVIACVGKGVMFDTGGYNIKMQLMSIMKTDCGGAGAVMGAARAVSLLQPTGVEVHFIVAACENMINDKAMVPSDVLTASNGMTIEVGDTDAEGRLTLADALVFADKEVGADSIIELSTLTGSCVMALGRQIGGLFTNDDALSTELAAISKVTGDKLWRMPVAPEYADETRMSHIADLRNMGPGGLLIGGAIFAANFLQHFVTKGKPFAHIDCAAPVFNEKIGATGYGARLVFEWIRRQGE